MPDSIQQVVTILINKDKLEKVETNTKETHVLGGLVAHGARRPKEAQVAILAVLLAILHHIVVRLQDCVTIHTSETLWMPHLIQGSHKLGSLST